MALSASVINAGSEPAIQVKVTFLGAAGGEEPQPVASGVVDVAPGASAIAAGAWTPDRGGAWRVSAALDDASAVGPPTQILVVAATTGEDAVAAAQHLTTGVVVSALVLLAIGAAFMARTGTTVFRS